MGSPRKRRKIFILCYFRIFIRTLPHHIILISPIIFLANVFIYDNLYDQSHMPYIVLHSHIVGTLAANFIAFLFKHIKCDVFSVVIRGSRTIFFQQKKKRIIKIKFVSFCLMYPRDGIFSGIRVALARWQFPFWMIYWIAAIWL